jgi:hypothetical protein
VVAPPIRTAAITANEDFFNGIEPLMPLSDATLREIAKVLRKHVAPRTLEQIAAELVEIRGDKDFRDTIERLVNALGLTSGR